MRLTTMALSCALVFASSAALARDLMANTYAITVITKSAKTGRSGTLLFNADGSYSTSTTRPNRKPLVYHGKWTLKDNGATICLSQTLPDPPTASCSPLQMHAVGDNWNVTNDQGESFAVSLIAGR